MKNPDEFYVLKYPNGLFYSFNDNKITNDLNEAVIFFTKESAESMKNSTNLKNDLKTYRIYFMSEENDDVNPLLYTSVDRY